MQGAGSRLHRILFLGFRYETGGLNHAGEVMKTVDILAPDQIRCYLCNTVANIYGVTQEHINQKDVFTNTIR